MTIFLITHKEVNKELLPDGKLLFVGASSKKNIPSGYLRDDLGITISEKNSHYCELTGLYWIWKNGFDKYIGIEHYRRFFTKNSLSTNKRYFYTDKELEQIAKQNKIIVPRRLYVKDDSIYKHYARYHYESDLIALRKVIEDNTPDYLDAFDEAFKVNYFYPYNMLYCSKHYFDQYCEWLFKILSATEEEVDISNYNISQARLFGFLGERLLNVWIIKNQLPITEIPIIQINTSFKYRVRLELDRVFHTALREKALYEK